MTQPTWMIRANTCASGRNSSVEASSVSNSSLELVDRDAELEHEVAVGEHAALGPAGRPRRVDQGRQVERGRGRPARLQLVVGDVARRGGSARRSALSSIDQTWFSSSSPARTSAIRARWPAPSATTARAPESRRIQRDLLGGRGLVDRYRDRAGEPDRVVEQRPLVAGPRDQGDPVAGLDAGRDQTLGDRRTSARNSAAVTSSHAAGASGGRLNDDAIAAPRALRHDVVGEVARCAGSSVVSGVENSRTRPPIGRDRGVRRGQVDPVRSAAPSRSGDARTAQGDPMAEQTTSSIVIDADPAAIMAVIGDFPAYPEWAKGVQTAEVVVGGRRRLGRAGVLRARRAPDQGRVHARLRVGRGRPGHLDPGRGQDAARPRRRLHADDLGNGSTEVTYRLALDVSIPLIGMLKRKGEKILIDTALKGLKKRVESLYLSADPPVHRQGRGRQVHGRGRDRRARRGRRPPHAGAVHRRRPLARRRVRRGRSAPSRPRSPTGCSCSRSTPSCGSSSRGPTSSATCCRCSTSPGSTRSRPRS